VNHRIVAEVLLHDPALCNGDLAEQRGRKREDDAALDLRGRAVHVHDVATVHGGVDVQHLETPFGRDRDMHHFGGDGAEAFTDGNAASVTGRERRAPTRHRRRLFERRLEARSVTEQPAPELERIRAGGVRHFVDERFLEEPVLRVQH